MLAHASATKGIIGVNVVVFLAMLATGAPTALDTLLRYGALPPFLMRDEWWRLFTAMFVHIGALHLLFNMYALTLFGPSIERTFGVARYLGLYFAGGLLGSAASLTFTDGGVRAGASGGVFAILGAWLAFALANRHTEMGRQQIQSLLFLVGINVALGLTVRGIDNAAHIGGLIGGLVIGAAFAASARMRAAGARAAAAVGIALVAVTAVFLLQNAWV